MWIKRYFLLKLHDGKSQLNNALFDQVRKLFQVI